MPAIIATLGKSVGMVALKLLLATFTEKLLAKATFYALEKLAEKTETKVDDELVVELKNQYYAVDDAKVKNLTK